MVYEFHNEVPIDALSREDTTQRYVLFIKSERNLVDSVPINRESNSCITKQ